MTKKIICILIIVIIIVASIFVAKKISKKQETIETKANNINELNTNEDENENVIKVSNEVLKTEKEDNKEETSLENEPETPEEKAIEIVKENWGEDDSVYFACEKKQDDGKYPVAVRDKNSTKALYWYYVDIESGTFDIK